MTALPLAEDGSPMYFSHDKARLSYETFKHLIL